MEARQAQEPLDRQTSHQITDALVALRGGAPDALERLVPLVYGDLRRIAHRQLGAERSDLTLSTTAVVHEAYLKLVDQTRAQWSDRAQFFAVAARAMRRILVDYARRHRAIRRGGGERPLSIDDDSAGAVAVAAQRADELVALDEALERLAAMDERLAKMVECRFFAGLTTEETAAILGVTARTVDRDWVKARAWLYRELRGDEA
jgi:RNA polymerase sigma factor (TIGR02999 family)